MYKMGERITLTLGPAVGKVGFGVASYYTQKPINTIGQTTYTRALTLSLGDVKFGPEVGTRGQEPKPLLLGVVGGVLVLVPLTSENETLGLAPVVGG